MKVESFHPTPLYRQAKEGNKIKNFKGEWPMNKKGEWGNNTSPTVIIEGREEVKRKPTSEKERPPKKRRRIQVEPSSSGLKPPPTLQLNLRIPRLRMKWPTVNVVGGSLDLG